MEQSYLDCLKEKEKEILGKMNGAQLDFVSDFGDENNISDIKYIEDCMNEFCDNHISVYTQDQINYYNEHTYDCDNAFYEYYGDLSGLEQISIGDLVAKAGVCGWYNEIMNELCEENLIEDLKNIQMEIKEYEDEE